MEIDVLSDLKCVCGESPIWDEIQNMLYWVDVPEGAIYRYDYENRSVEYFQVSQKIGSIALTCTGNLIAALKEGFYKVCMDEKKQHFINAPISFPIQNRFNDGKCDSTGRFWAGSMSDEIEKENKGSLYTLEKNGQISKKLSDLTISNGMCWSLDSRVFYHIDTPRFVVRAFDYSVDEGVLTNARNVIQIDPSLGAPDGMTIDTEGMLWIAHWGGGRLSRWNPFLGKMLMEVLLPVSKITSCTFGGRLMDELFVEDVGDDGIKNGITQKFKAFIIHPFPFLRAT